MQNAVMGLSIGVVQLVQRESHVRLLRCILLVLAVFGFATLGTAAAQSDTLVVTLRSPVLVLGGDTALEIEVRDRRPDAIRLPSVDGLTFGPIGEPFYYSRSVFDGVRTTRQESWVYRVSVSADRVGNFRIPPVVAVFGRAEQNGPIVELDVVLDDHGEQSGYLEIKVPFERVVVGQGFPIEIEFGCRATVADVVGAWDVTLPWISTLGRDAVQEIPPSAREGDPVEITVNRASVVRASAPRTVEINGQSFRVLRLRLFVTPLRSGTIDLSGSVLRFRTGQWRRSVFGNDFVADREFFKRVAPASFEVAPLPDENRPLAFTGAVGAISARSSLDVSEMFVGDSFKLTVDFTGSGNLGDFAAPNLELDPLFAESFAVYGSNQQRSHDRFRVVYDMAPLHAGVDEVPPVGLWVFDPELWDYRRVETAAVPIGVRSRGTEAPPTGASGSTGSTRTYERDIHDIRTKVLRAAGLEGSAPRDFTLVGVFGATLVVWAALRAAGRRDRLVVGSPAERRRAVRLLERQLERAGTPEQDLRAWAGFVSSRLGHEPTAWIGRDVRGEVRSGRLELGEVATDLLARTSERLESAAFGDEPRVDRGVLVATARDLMEEGL